MPSARRCIITLTVSAALLTGAALFYTAQTVQALEKELQALNRHIDTEKEMIQVLKAEWQYLNRPARLEHLSKRHLELDIRDMRQIVAVAAIPDRAEMTDHSDDPHETAVNNKGSSGPAIVWGAAVSREYRSRQAPESAVKYPAVRQAVPLPSPHPRRVMIRLSELWGQNDG